MKNLKKVILLSGLVLILGITSTAYAYNYKFSFDMNTGMWHKAAYSKTAYKYTATEAPVLRVSSVESKVLMNFVVVNSQGKARTGVISTKGSISKAFSNNNTSKNYGYRLKAYTDDGHFYNTYNITGSWNPDSY